MMRLLLINPNTTQAMTDQMTAVAHKVAGPEVDIVPITARRGVPYIASRAEAQIAGGEVLEIIAQHQSGADAAIIAAFGDPGIVAARELFDLPIVGMAEAAVVTAALLGERFGVVTFSPHMAPWYVACVSQTGLAARFTGVRCPKDPPARVDNVASALRDDLVQLAKEATDIDGAEVVILGGAPLAGLAQELAADAPGVLIDPIAAATLQAIAMARLKPDYRNRPGRPAAKSSIGLDPALAGVIARQSS